MEIAFRGSRLYCEVGENPRVRWRTQRTTKVLWYYADSASHPMPSLQLTTEVQYVKGIGPRVAEVLTAKGIATVEDLLYYLPFRYEDRLNPRTIAELRPGEMATVIAEVRTSGLFRTRSRLDIFHMTAGQGRTTLKCLWFHGRYLEGKFRPGQMVALYG